MKDKKMIKAFLTILFWRIWDFSIKLIWPYLGIKTKQILRDLIDSKQIIKIKINNFISKKSGVIIQVGSNDGISNDHLRDFIKDTACNVYLIEPLPFLVKKLRELYKDHGNVKVLEFAILPKVDIAPFYHLNTISAKEMGKRWKSWYDQIGSFSKKHLMKHSKELVPFIKILNIKCKPLDNVISEEGIKEILLLNVDAEGYDVDVINTISLNKIKPWVLLFEHKHANVFDLMILLRKLKSHGYRYTVTYGDIVCFNDI